VTRIEANHLILNKEPFNLNEKIRNVIRDIQGRVLTTRDETTTLFSLSPPQPQQQNQGNKKDKKNIQIKFEPKTDPVIVEIDKTRIFEVISNLLTNAIKFTDDHGGTILITSEIAGKENNGIKEEALVKVKDTGKGIDPDIFPKLFTKFATKSEQGTGLGLYISKAIVEAHGGRIWAENNTDGKGATFSFTLPIK
jgi:signal transduction histidine kinase